ncbi:hypothetical protein DFH28DRAFT_1085294 [Melampsora americana]|nr:hypothetical protein DFH28DRAFT_1085294 [Melampsora americana]
MTNDASLNIGEPEFPNAGQRWPQESSQANQSGLHGLNNHGALRNLNRSGDFQLNCRAFEGDQRPSATRIGGRFTPTRKPNERSLSPTQRTSAGSSFHHEMNEDPLEPRHYACPLGTQSHQTFEEMSNEAGLDLDSHAFALMHAQVFGENNRHLSQKISQARLLMEVSALQQQIQPIKNHLATITNMVQTIVTNPQPLSQPDQSISVNQRQADEPWKASEKPLDILNPLALRLMESPELQAYTTSLNGPEGYLPHSLFNTIKLNITKDGPPFTSKYLPPQHLAPKKYYIAIRDCAKCAREKIHNVLLAGIHVPTKGDHTLIPVPNLMDLVQQFRVKCGSVGPNCGAKAVWEVTDLPKRARIAYLRWEAASIVLKGGRGTLAALINSQQRLRHFYNIVCDEDNRYFDGRTFLQEVKDNQVTLNSPSHEAILARIPGGGQSGNGSASGSGNVHE